MGLALALSYYTLLADLHRPLHLAMALKSLFSKGNKDALPPPTAMSGDDTTLAPSHAASLADEKVQPTATVTVPEFKDSEKKDGDEEEEEDDTEYPKSTQLFLITVALCFSVFCKFTKSLLTRH